MLKRFKVTKLPNAAGDLEVFIDKSNNILVHKTCLTLPLYSSNVVRDVTLERPDGTVLATQKAVYLTSASIGLVFPDDYLLPKIEPILTVSTHSVHVAGAGRSITVEAVYEVLE